MKQKVKRFFGIILGLALLLSLMPCMSLTVYAAGEKAYSAYDVTTETNKSGNDLTALQVSFNERQWYIIEDNSSSATSGTVTLLSADTTFGTKKFDDNRNKYSTSQVKTYLDSMTGTGGAFAGVAEAIETVNLTTNQYETVNNVKLYLLSTEEAKSLPENVRKAEFTGEDFSDNEWWLRSPGLDHTHAAFVKGDVGNVYDDGYIVGYAFGVRPALKLDLSAVIFDSESKTFSCITGLGTGAIKDPTPPSATTDPWKGNYVYYGKYGDTPTKYRVLDKASSDFGVTGNSLLLDCDNVLYNAKFDEDGEPNSGAHKANEWAYSDVKNGLNGNSFLTKAGNFTSVERSAIAESTKAAASAGDGDGWSALGYVSLSGEKIFLLDTKEAERNSYGYSNSDNSAKNREKTESDPSSRWWLRSPYAGIDYTASGVLGGGEMWGINVSSSHGVSPAFNISLPSIIFSSLVSGTSGSEGAEYKLTLKDPGLSIAAGAVDNGNNEYLVSYDIKDNSSSAAPTQVSVVVTDGTWSTDSGWSEGANLLQYAKLEMNPFSLSGTGTFTLDGSITGTLGTDYHLYVLAEDKNGEKETDFASEPVEIEAIPSYLLKYAPGDGGTGSMASESVSPTEVFTFPECGFTALEGKSFYYWEMSGVDGIIAPNSTVIIADNCAQGGVVTVTAHWKSQPAPTPTPPRPTPPSSTPTTPVKSTAYVLTAPVANTLTYNGQAQELVTEGKAIGGMMHYAVGTSETTAPNDGWSTKVPTAADAGTYFIWYKVLGDSDHKDFGPSYVGAAEIIEKHSDNVLSIDEEKGIATVKDAVSGGTEEVPLEVITEGPIYRMYDPNRGEHFYTKDPGEAESLVQLGWRHESDSDFTVVDATEEDAIPVYRLYNPNFGGMHFYTTSADEAKYLKSIGWNYEGISHYVYSASSTKGTPQYRLYNPNSPCGEHNWTSDEAEVDRLREAGWINEGIYWRVA